MSLRDVARRAAVLDTLKRAISEEARQAREDLEVEIGRASEESGTRQITVDLGGADIGKAALVQPKPTVTVTDQAALLAWVRSVAPTEVTSRVVTEVRPAYLDALLKRLSVAGVAEWVDPVTGVIHEVPGVEVREGEAHTRLSIPAEGRAAIGEAWRSGELLAVVLPALAAGEE